MHQTLVVVWWSSAVIGGLGLLLALVSAQLRRSALTAAAVGFLVAGVLGILSIGLLFLLLASLCALAAPRVSSTTAD